MKRTGTIIGGRDVLIRGRVIPRGLIGKRFAGLAIVAAMATLSLVACDTYSGVTRSAEVSHLPSAECVVHALESIPGVTNVRHELDQGEEAVTWSGIQSPDAIHSYFYDFEGLHGHLYFTQDYEGRVEFYQAYGRLNATPPQEEIDTIYPVMRALEKQLEQDCGLIGLTLSVVEGCQGVRGSAE